MSTNSQWPADQLMLATASAAQAAVLLPHHSVWVGANAGTGKTTVLTRRMLTLLLADPTLEPRQLLALTFTRAAAAEMAARFMVLLQEWAALDEAEAQGRCTAQLGLAPPEGLLKRLDLLLMQARAQPPLMTTLHGFAQQMLASLPAAAGLPEGFGLLTEGEQNRLMNAVQNQALQTLPETIAPYLGSLLDEMGDQAWQDLTETMVQSWWKLEEVLAAQSLPQMLGHLQAKLDLPPRAEAFAALVPPAPLGAAVQPVWGEVGADEEAWLTKVLVKTGARKGLPKARLLSAAEVKVVGAATHEQLAAFAEHASAMLRARRSWRGLALTEALLVWAAHIRGLYQAAKQQQGVLDFSDLLRGLEKLFTLHETEAAVGWLWHRLDRRVRHMVVDEAQDNNAAQSRIVAWLARLLLAGEVGTTPRTVLAVGDMKQSIYRFQGAQPEHFLKLRDLLETWAGHFTNAQLTHTFRNGAAVLEVVNNLFGEPERTETLMGEAAPWPLHQTVVPGRPSRVELWPRVAATPDDAEQADDDDIEAGGPAPDEPPTRWLLAHERAAAAKPSAKWRCLQQVAPWLVATHGARPKLPSTGKALSWADVLIVVQTNDVAQLMASVLRQHHIPVAAAQGIVPPVSEDVMAVLRVMHNRADTLSLAQMLKGLEGWDDAALEELLLQVHEERLPHAFAALPAAHPLVNWLEGLPAALPPAARVVAIAARYGLDMAPLTPLLAWAEAADAKPVFPYKTPLQLLLERLETEALPVAAEAGVRILTVYRAKGLEAPLVILPQTERPMDALKETLLWGEGAVWVKPAGMKGAAGEWENNLQTHEKKKIYTDNLRALYVALTRAADWLVIAGWEQKKRPQNG